MAEAREAQRSEGYPLYVAEMDGTDILQDDEFETIWRPAGDIGTIRLHGKKNAPFEKDDMGIAVTNKGIVIDKAQKLSKKGMFHTNVQLTAGGYEPIPAPTCLLQLPQGFSLNGQFVLSDEVSTILSTMSGRSETKQYGTTTKWERPHDSTKYALFVGQGKDATPLRQMYFSVKSTLPNPPASQ